MPSATDPDENDPDDYSPDDSPDDFAGDPSDPSDDSLEPSDRPSDPPDDPRIETDFVRRVGDVTLVGVVHDHPASVFRAGAVIDSREPAVVALELPPLVVPLFRSLAGKGGDSPTGGEMTAAIAAAPDARHVGIDAFDSRFVRTLLGHARADGASIRTVGSLAREAMAFSRTVLYSRIAALGPLTHDAVPPRHEQTGYDCKPTDPPAVQAARERDHVARCRVFARAVRTPDAVQHRDEARENCMAERIDALRRTGDVVAVVGLAHLEPVAERLAST